MCEIVNKKLNNMSEIIKTHLKYKIKIYSINKKFKTIRTYRK